MKINDIYSGLLFGSSGSGGGGGNAFVVHLIWDEEIRLNRLDKTANEIMDAMLVGSVIITSVDEESGSKWSGVILTGWTAPDGNMFILWDGEESIMYSATTNDDYPTQVIQG